MYARLQTTSALPQPADPQQLNQVVDTIAGHPGFAGLYALRQVDDDRAATLLTLWDTEEDARRASERTAAQLGARPMELDFDEVYEVEDDWHGASADEAPTAAQLISFDGPISQERADAARFASRERISPLMATFPGAVRAIALWHSATRSMVVLSLATSLQALDEGNKVIMSSELLPGENPELLSDPDRLTVNRVEAHHVGTQQGAVS